MILPLIFLDVIIVFPGSMKTPTLSAQFQRF